MIGRRFTSVESLRSNPPSPNERRSLVLFFQNRRAIDSPDPYFAVMFEQKITGHIYRSLLFVFFLITVLLSSFHVCCLAGELYCGRLLSARHLSGKSCSSQHFPSTLKSAGVAHRFPARARSHGVRARIKPSASKPFLSFHFSRIRSVKAERCGVHLARAPLSQPHTQTRTRASITVTSGG